MRCHALFYKARNDVFFGLFAAQGLYGFASSSFALFPSQKIMNLYSDGVPRGNKTSPGHE